MHDMHLSPTIVVFGHSLWADEVGVTSKSFGILWLNMAVFFHLWYKKKEKQDKPNSYMSIFETDGERFITSQF